MTHPSFSRRTALGLLATAGASAMTGAASATPASASPTATNPQAGNPARTQAATLLSRPDSVFLRRGLMHGAWVRNNSTTYCPSAQTWLDSGFTTPTFYDAYPLWNPTLMAALPAGTTWAVAKAPRATHLNDTLGYPDPQAEWLTAEQQARASDLFTACFGDEDNYSENYMTFLASAFARMHATYPDVLVHTNQAVAQFSDAQMRTYIQRTQPDLLTFDFYYWMKAAFYPGGSVAPLYGLTGRYRRLALEGLDGAGNNPLAFGQYTTGFRLTPPDNSVGGSRRFVVSESQQKAVAFVTMAMGGKWLDLFRWEGYSSTTQDTDGHFLAYADGSPTPQFTRYQELNQSIAALAPYLVRLRTTKVAVKYGVVGDSSSARQTQSEVPTFSSTTDTGSGVVALTSANVGTANGGQPGDVLLGTFRNLPNMSTAEAGSVLPNKDATTAFMLVNTLLVSNANPLVTNTATDYAPHTSTGGNGADTRQQITVTVNRANVSPTATRLFRVNQSTGAPVEVALTAISGGRHQFSVTIDGGEGELFYWS